METEEFKEILIELLDLVSSLEGEIRSLEVLTSHRVNHLVTEKLGIPQNTNALHAQVQSLRARVNKLGDKKDSSR
jgi:polyhydroxyalkanoate synthesis regulator phasin